VLLRSLSLRSFPKSSFFFSYLFVHLIIIFVSIVRYSQTQRSFFFSLHSFFSLLSVARDHHRFHVYRALRMFVLASVFARHYSFVVCKVSMSRSAS
jgi:hypothetical protein